MVPERENLAPRFQTGDFPWNRSGGPPTPTPPAFFSQSWAQAKDTISLSSWDDQ